MSAIPLACSRNFKLSDAADVYGEFMFMDDRSVAQIAPSGAFLGAATFAVNCNNPYFSPSMRQEFCGAFGWHDEFGQLLIGRRNTEGGGRQDDIGHESYRIVAGVRGDINDVLSYDAYYLNGEVKRNSTYLNDFSTRRTALALNAVDGRPTAASAVLWSTSMPTRATTTPTACHGTSGRMAASIRRPLRICRLPASSAPRLVPRSCTPT